jgi:hypothetical protein
MTQDQILSLVRDVLKYAGAYAVTKGWVSNEIAVWVAGGIAAFAGTAWSLWVKRPTGLVASAAALPEVRKVVANSSIADGTLEANPKVVVN